jgi:multiple sugar transport system substrate-binding protein
VDAGIVEILRNAMQEVVDAYNAAQGVEDGIEVEMILLSRDDTFARQATEIGTQSSDVDIYFVATYNVGFFSSGLDPIDDVGVDEANYFPVAVDGLTIDDQLYALPLDISNHFLYYRTDLIDTLLTDEDWQATYREVSAEVLGEGLVREVRIVVGPLSR